MSASEGKLARGSEYAVHQDVLMPLFKRLHALLRNVLLLLFNLLNQGVHLDNMSRFQVLELKSLCFGQLALPR